MARQNRTNRTSKSGTDRESVKPLRHMNSDSELDEYIHLGEDVEEEEDLFDDETDDEEDEEDATPDPTHRARHEDGRGDRTGEDVPLEKLVEDVPEIGQSLDPVRMYLRDIGRHPLLTGEEELELAQQIAEGVAAEDRLQV